MVCAAQRRGKLATCDTPASCLCPCEKVRHVDQTDNGRARSRKA
ncbi:hypothetical protein NP493_1488g00028 [Ridgeia piscesae]|uniref:Uncharacterized protein n=1 Tax=Ridgeia piscesae TaxID=27915 RepID=A0AAD9NCB8_RIDPI|nr:hypothetical protein NP493_1488g00028 [Ridgeia piscesae]